MTLNDVRTYGIVLWQFVDDQGSVPLNILLIGTVIMAVLSYLMGSLNFAVIISRIKYHDDIRNHGSGNAGSTNMIRTYGTAAGIFTFVGDLAKAIISVLLTMFLLGEASAYIAGVFCIIGHIFPCWYRFKGGKGVAVAAAMLLATEPVVFLILIASFVIIVLFTKYISLGSIMAALLYPIVLSKIYPLTHGDHLNSLFFIMMICALIVTILILVMHRENMKRLLNGTENKFSFNKKGARNSNENIKK